MSRWQLWKRRFAVSVVLFFGAAGLLPWLHASNAAQPLKEKSPGTRISVSQQRAATPKSLAKPQQNQVGSTKKAVVVQLPISAL